MSRSARRSKQERSSDMLVLPPTVLAVAAHYITVNGIEIKEGVDAAPFLGDGHLSLGE